jgi:ubiquinone/menaquinone biosynthesis C-methylase UbiE
VWCCAALLPVPHDGTALAEFRRVLRGGGHLALVTALGQGTSLEPVPYAPATDRWFFYRDRAQLAGKLSAARLHVLAMTEEPTSRHWVKVLARAG